MNRCMTILQPYLRMATILVRPFCIIFPHTTEQLMSNFFSQSAIQLKYADIFTHTLNQTGHGTLWQMNRCLLMQIQK